MKLCDKCGLADEECKCYIYELKQRICLLEEGLDQLTNIFKQMSDYLKKEDV